MSTWKIANKWLKSTRSLPLRPPLGTNSNKASHLFSAVGCVYSITLQIIHELKMLPQFNARVRFVTRVNPAVTSMPPARKNQLTSGYFEVHSVNRLMNSCFHFSIKYFILLPAAAKTRPELKLNSLEMVEWSEQIAIQPGLTPLLIAKLSVCISWVVHFFPQFDSRLHNLWDQQRPQAARLQLF